MTAKANLSPLERVARIARAMRGVILFGVAFEVVGVVALWSVESLLRGILLPEIGMTSADVTLTPTARIVGFLICLVPVGLSLSILADAYKLFRAYAAGEVFSLAATVPLRRIAMQIIGLAALGPFTRTALVLALTFANPPGQRLLAFGFGSGDYMAAALGGLLLAISWVMVEAARVAEENKEFV